VGSPGSKSDRAPSPPAAVPPLARDVREEPKRHGLPSSGRQEEAWVVSQGGGAGPGPSPVCRLAQPPGVRMREVRSECEKAVLGLKRGDSNKALKLAKEACARFPRWLSARA